MRTTPHAGLYRGWWPEFALVAGLFPGWWPEFALVAGVLPGWWPEFALVAGVLPGWWPEFALVALVALALLVLGVVGSVVPVVPGGLFSLAGVLLYWWGSGFTEPDTVALVGLVLLALLAVAADWLGGAVSARAGGASLVTVALAGLTGFVLLFVLGPLGVLLGVAGVVFLAEYRRHGDASRGARTAVYAAVGLLASTVVQVALTVLLLVSFVVVVVF